MNNESPKNILIETDKYTKMLDVCCAARIFVDNLSDYIHEIYDCIPWDDFNTLERAVKELSDE